MRTDDLIDRLSTGLEPTRSGAVARLLAGAVLVGVAGSALLLLALIGPRHDLSQFHATPRSFDAKAKAVISSAGGYARMTCRQGCPHGRGHSSSCLDSQDPALYPEITRAYTGA